MGQITDAFADILETNRPQQPGDSGEDSAGGSPSTGDSFVAHFGWLDAVIETAKIINDKWDAVFELPAITFLMLLRYRKAKIEHERQQAAKASGKIIY